MEEERTKYDKQMDQLYKPTVYTPQTSGANFSCEAWCKSQGLGPPPEVPNYGRTWLGTAPECRWDCGQAYYDSNNNLQLKNPNVAYQGTFGSAVPRYTCSLCIASNSNYKYIGLNPSNKPGGQGDPRPVPDVDLNGLWTDFGGTCTDYSKVCCCDAKPYTGNE